MVFLRQNQLINLALTQQCIRKLADFLGRKIKLDIYRLCILGTRRLDFRKFEINVLIDIRCYMF